VVPADVASRVPAAFAGLTDRHRLLLQLSAADGLTYSEIARLTRASIGEVTSSCYGAKLELSQALGILPPPRPEPTPLPEEASVAPPGEADAGGEPAGETTASPEPIGEPELASPAAQPPGNDSGPESGTPL
jgi:hypothetical protein